MIEFGNLNAVDQTYVKKSGGFTKGQNWEGIKYRATETKGTDGELERTHTFMVSDETFDSLNLEENGLKQFVGDGEVYLAVVTDNDKATFMKRKQKKDGGYFDKGKSFSNVFLEKDLADAGIISTDDSTIKVNQFISLEKAEVPGTPEWVTEMYKLVAGEAESDDSDDDAQEADAPQAEAVASDFE